MVEIDPVSKNKNEMESDLPVRRAFNDSGMQAEFEENGYVVIPGFLDRETMSALEQVYMKFSHSVNTGFHVTNWLKDNTYSKESHEKVCLLLSDRLSPILDKYKPVLGCFAVKEAGYDNTMGLHQDWSLTDESIYHGISAWVPLVDVTKDSGAVQILRGSHHLFTNIRGQKIKNQLDAISPDTIHRYITTIPMQAGDLLLLHHRVVHCSGSTSARRIAAMMAVIPAESKVKHYMADMTDDSGRALKVYDCPDDFYVDFDIEAPPPPDLVCQHTKQTDRIVTASMIDHYHNR